MKDDFKEKFKNLYTNQKTQEDLLKAKAFYNEGYLIGYEEAIDTPLTKIIKIKMKKVLHGWT